MVTTSSLSVITGQPLVLKTPPKPVIDEMVIQNPAGLKMALGENPKRENALVHNRYPKTRLGLAATIREALVAAQNYSMRQTYEKENDRPIVRDLSLEALVGLLRGEYPIHMHVHRADDIATAVRIAHEFNVSLVLHHATEAYKVTEFLARHRIPVVCGPFIWWKSKTETRELDPAGVCVAMEAGLKVAITTDHPVVPIEYVMFNALAVIRAGLSPELALRALTLYPAEILGLGHRIGSLEPGKDADLVLFSNDPFAADTRVRAVYVDGQRVWDANDSLTQGVA
jgi:imidazolonepropionase-like amidohydrolase